jgi:diaminopimelate decarboxylase
MTADATARSPVGHADPPAVRRLADWDAARLRDLAAEHDTPCYVLDLDRVHGNLARVRDAFPDAEVRYAAKANAARPLLGALADEGAGVECASAGEVRRALAAGVPGDRVRYTAVNPPAGDLDSVVAAWEDGAALSVTAGAADTVDRLADRGYDGPLLVRVTPGVGAGHHEKVVTGSHPTFGVPAARATDVLDRAEDAGMDVVGVHAHLGSGVTDAPDDLDAYRAMVDVLADVVRDATQDCSTVDVGGGFAVPYHPDEAPVDLHAVADVVREGLDGLDVDLELEPGRALVADAGVLLARVNTVKETPGTVVAGVDAGMTTLLRPAMYDAHHEIRNLDAEADGDAGADGAGRREVGVTVAGPVCESADVLCENRPLPQPRRGDLLAVGNAGAYGIEMASTYNSRPRPPEVVLEDGDARLARRRETLADLDALDVEVER